METVRKYGTPPFKVALVHGGPGASGEMAPVARRLAPARGVLEPIQTATTLEGQVQELRAVLETCASLPVILMGFSWGAWLSFIVAARYPHLVEKLIMVGSGPFQDGDAESVGQTRLERFTEIEREEFEALVAALRAPGIEDRDSLFRRLGALTRKSDGYDPLTTSIQEHAPVAPRSDVFQGVWPEAAEMRRSGELLDLGRHIRCPVVAIHGDYDPHPAEGVRRPLAATLDQFRFILLERCGHKPWIERQAGDAFYRVLKAELA